MSKKLLGKVGVDSGVLVITDPCYVNKKLNTTAFKAIHPKNDETDRNTFGTLPNGLSLAFHSGYGDGLYEVYGEFEKGVLIRVIIEMG